MYSELSIEIILIFSVVLKDFSSISWILLLLRHLEENLFLFFLIKICIQIRPTKKIPTVSICEALIPWISINSLLL